MTELSAQDPTGEVAAQAAYDNLLVRFKALVKETFENVDLKHDDDLIDMLTDEMHESIDEALTTHYGEKRDDGLDVSDIDDSE